MRASDLFDFPDSLPFRDFFSSDSRPWEWVSAIKVALENFDFPEQPDLEIPPGVHITGKVFIHPTVQLPPTAVIHGPCYIGARTILKPGAYIRGNVIVGEDCMLGNSCEYKNCMLMDKVETAHFNYVGDSILGTRVHLGAGVITANLKLARDEVKAYTDTGRVATGLNKLGAMVGEGVEVGCNAVLQPGTILGKRSVVMSGMPFSGYLPAGKLARISANTEIVPFR